MAAEVNKKLSNIIECSICMEIFTDSRMLPCIHTFCAKCLSETGSKSKKGPGDKMPCPLCRTEFTVPMDGFTGLKKNFFVDKFVEVIQLSSKQNACHSNTGKCSSAKWYCHECKQKLCDECFKLHKEIKTLKHHNLVPIDDQTDSKKLMEFCNATVCDQHETEELKVFCDDCQVVQCALCLLERHQSHKWSYVKEVANKFRTQIVSNADMLSGSVPEAQRIIEQLDKDNIEFLETVIKIESEVNEKKLRIKALFEEIVDEEARSLLLKLSSYKQAKSKESGIEKEDIDGHVTELNSYIMFCSEITAKGSDVDICRAVNDLNSRAKELKESHGTVMQRTPASRRRPISFEERKSEDFLKTCGNLLGKIEGTHQNMPSSQHQQQSSVLYSQQNPPQVVMHGMQGNVFVRPYMVQPGSMMNAQLPQAPQQTAQAIRQSMMMQPRFPGQMPPYQQQPQQQQPGFVQQEQQHYSQMLPPDSNYHLATAGGGMHPTYFHAMPVQQQVPQRSDGAMPGNPLPPQVYAAGGQMQQPNAQQWQMYQQAQALQRFQSLVPVRFPQQMPIQRMMPATMPQPGMPQEMPTEAVARPPMHVGEPTQRPPFVPRPPRSDIVYYDPLKAGNDLDEKASQAAKPKAKNVLAIIDPSTGQNVLETLEMSSRQTTNEALKIQSEFAHKVTQRISLGDKAGNINMDINKPTQLLRGIQPNNFLATAPTAALDENQPLEVKRDQGLVLVYAVSSGSELVNSANKVNVQSRHIAEAAAAAKLDNGRTEESLSCEAAEFIPAALRTMDAGEKKPFNNEAPYFQPGPEGLLDSGVESLLEEPSTEVKEDVHVELPVSGEEEEDQIQQKALERIHERVEEKLEEKIQEKSQEKALEKEQEKAEENVQEKSQERVQEKLEGKIQEKSLEKAQEKAEEKVLEKSQERVQEKLEEKVQEKSLEKAQEKAEEKVQEKSLEKAQEKAEEKVREKSLEKVQDKAEEKVVEKSQERVQDKLEEKVREKSLEKSQEKAEENIQEKSQEKAQRAVPVVKLPQVETEELQKPPPVAKQLQVEQGMPQVLFPNVVQIEETVQAPLPAAGQSEKENAKPPAEIAYSRTDLTNNVAEKLSEVIDSDHQPVVEETTLVESKAEQNLADLASSADAVVDENGEEDVQADLEDGEDVEPKNKSADLKLQYNYEPGQWTPLNPDGKKVYSRDFLMQLQFIPESVQTPPGLPDLPEIVRSMVPTRDLPRDQSFSSVSSVATYSGYDFTPRFAHDTLSMGRAPVKRGSFQKRNEPPVKIINIRRSEDVQLHKTEQAWKPTLVNKDDVSDPEAIKTAELYKKMKGILNKITPSTFEKLLTQITELPIDNESRLSGCIAIIFEKALSEPKFVKEYSNLAQRMMSLSVPSTDNPATKVTFRKLLLNRCQEEFEKDQQDERDIIRRQKEIEETTTEDQKKRLIEEKEELVSRSRRRSLGNIRFIGELFKLKMLTEKIMHDCIKKLLDAEDEDSLELLCNLFKTIGKELDTDKAKKLMDSYFIRLGDKQGSVPSRIRFMIKDLLELRRNKWVPRRLENIPKTIVEIHKEANEEKELAKQQLLNRAPLPPKPRQDRRLPGSSSTEKTGDDGWTMAVSSNMKNRIDTTKMMQIAKSKKDSVFSLKPQWQMGISGLASQGSSQEAEKPSMPSNRFSALEHLGAGRKMNENLAYQRFPEFPSSSGRVSSLERNSSQDLRRGSSPQGAAQRTGSPLLHPVLDKDIRKDQEPVKELSREAIEHKAESLLEEYLHVQDLREAITCVKELESPKSLHIFVSFAINYVLEKKESARILTGTLLHQLMSEEVMSFEQCELGFKEVLQDAESLAVDIPKVWEYLGEILAGTIKVSHKMWQLLKTGCQELAPNKKDVLFRKTMAVVSHKLGADRTSKALRRSEMRWSDFVSSGLFSYTKQYNLEQLDPVREELIALLKQHTDNQPIFDWIQRNVTTAEAETREFIRALVTAVCTRAITGSETSTEESASYSVSEPEIVSRQTLLQRYLDHKPDREIQALYALQALVHSLEHPSNILHSFFNILYDKDIIAEDAFWEWKNSTDPAEQTGRGVAIQSVRPFFDWLSEGTEEMTGS